MRKAILITFKLAILVLVFTSCPDKADYAQWSYIKNQSDHDIFAYVTQCTEKEFYEETLLPLEILGYVIESRSFEGLYMSSEIYGHKIFILSMDTIAKYSWEEIRLTNNILKRYDLKASDLEKLNYSISYP